MSGGQSDPSGFGRTPADSSGRRSNTIHRGIYSRLSDLERRETIHIPPCGYPQDEDSWTLATDGRYWPTGYLLAEIDND